MIEGAYENFRTGTILREATLLVTAENGRLLIQEARASDGEKGSVALNGWFELSPDPGFPFHLDIVLRDATLIRHDSVTATMGGDLVFAGNRQGALLSGEVDSPELSLTSQPPLPDDEILSRLLFGRTVTQITPLQALQLANALDVLAGRQGFDVIDHTRRMLGLDFLEIRDLGVELDAAALRAGKYLAENVYIEVEQGLGPESGRASLQWEITPNITIQTEVGINAEAGAGIGWKWDY